MWLSSLLKTSSLKEERYKLIPDQPKPKRKTWTIKSFKTSDKYKVFIEKDKLICMQINCNHGQFIIIPVQKVNKAYIDFYGIFSRFKLCFQYTNGKIDEFSGKNLISLYDAFLQTYQDYHPKYWQKQRKDAAVLITIAQNKQLDDKDWKKLHGRNLCKYFNQDECKYC